MIWFIAITLIIIAIMALVVIHKYKEEKQKNQPWIIKLICSSVSVAVSMLIIVAVAFAISGYQHHLNEEKILNDILINGTPPVVEFKVSSDTVLNDSYWYTPGEYNGIRYPLKRGAIDKD